MSLELEFFFGGEGGGGSPLLVRNMGNEVLLLDNLSAKEAASAGAKLLCFPEAFSFVGAKDGDSVSIAEPLDGPIMEKYCSLARW